MRKLTRGIFFTRRSAYDNYDVGIEEAIKSDPRDLKKKRVGYSSVMLYEGRLAFGTDDNCDLFADFIQRT
jgi:hypothetical protein